MEERNSVFLLFLPWNYFLQLFSTLNCTLNIFIFLNINTKLCENHFCSFRVGWRSAFIGTSKFHLTLYFCGELLKIVQVNTSTFFYSARQKSKYNYINIQTTHLISVTFFSNFLSFDSRVFIFFVFCILSNKLNSIFCHICLSYKSRHLELSCKIII